MNMLRTSYQFGLDRWGLALFLAVMLPNFLWFAVPAPCDILRAESLTPVLDAVASVLQVLLAAALCLLRRREAAAVRRAPWNAAAALCVLAYYAGWAAYYDGNAGALVLALLTVPPCLSFLFYTAGHRNLAALVPAAAFTVCHLLHSILNYWV